ncbi:MAG: sensor histidine kinase, partial [Methanosarcina sp.]
LGMIINELVSNSFKYAFPDNDKGTIQIKLFSEETTDKLNNKKSQGQPNQSHTRYTLIVSDDGIGIPENLDIENSSTLGLQLVNILIDQIDGCIELKRENGTEFFIWFNNLEKIT